MSELFAQIHRAITLQGIPDKCSAAQALPNKLRNAGLDHASEIHRIATPGLPAELELVPPRKLKRRGMHTQAGRNSLMHAIAHIEFNAINLALDAAYRFRNQPIDYYHDWLSVAADEARHFMLIQDYLTRNGSQYGDLPVHNGLWEMAVATDHDVLARMALVPRVLEARGLDVTPSMIDKLTLAGDTSAADILNTIYHDEIGHVAIGSKWFRYHCAARELEPHDTFRSLVKTHLHGELRGPFNDQARLLAGFEQDELNRLTEEQHSF